MKKGLFALLMVIAFFAGCNLKDGISLPEDFDLGTTEDNIYTNKYFGMQLYLPQDWMQQSREDLEALMQMGEAYYEDKKMKKVIKAASVRSATLVGVFKYPMDSLVEFNPSLLIIAENIRLAPSIKTGADYLEQAKKMMKQATIEYEFEEGYRDTQISNKDFAIMDVSTESEFVGTIYQQYYTTISNGFALCAVITYTSDEDKAFLEDVVGDMVFKKSN